MLTITEIESPLLKQVLSEIKPTQHLVYPDIVSIGSVSSVIRFQIHRIQNELFLFVKQSTNEEYVFLKTFRFTKYSSLITYMEFFYNENKEK